ncbi:hypothetical protein GGH95_006273, partial [Coemansia sp. RSA 1836]
RRRRRAPGAVEPEPGHGAARAVHRQRPRPEQACVGPPGPPHCCWRRRRRRLCVRRRRPLCASPRRPRAVCAHNKRAGRV